MVTLVQLWYCFFFFFFTKTLFQITVRGRHNMDDRLDYETFHLLKTVFFFFFCALDPQVDFLMFPPSELTFIIKQWKLHFRTVSGIPSHTVSKKKRANVSSYFYFCIRPTLCVFYHNLSFYVTGRSSESDC